MKLCKRCGVQPRHQWKRGHGNVYCRKCQSIITSKDYRMEKTAAEMREKYKAQRPKLGRFNDAHFVQPW